MSATPTHAGSPTQAASTKRPLEEPSSPNGQDDQPDAKRPALDKIVKEDVKVEDTNAADLVKAEDLAPDAVKEEGKDTSLTQNGTKDAEGDTVVPDAPSNQAILDVQPIQSTAGANGGSGSQSQQQDESNSLYLRAVISTSEAATVIGKGGENVSEIRKLSGAKCTVSDYVRGAVERILTVSGPVDAVSKAFGLIVRTLNNEPLEQPSTAQSKTYPMRLLIPHILIGSIIGKAGTRIREIQDVSNARLNASDGCLPMSGERSLVVLGVADAVHIAIYYVAQTLVEQLTERFGGPAASNYATRHGHAQTVTPGGLQVVPYQPQMAGGQYNTPDNYRKPVNQAPRTPAQGYGGGYGMQTGQPHQQATAMHYGAGSPARGHYSGLGPQQPSQYGAVAAPPTHTHGAAPTPAAMGGMGGAASAPLTQQIYIPNDMVGAIIGKGGSKINEIRTMSGSVIKINEPTDNSNERLVTITGPQESNQVALYMLYARLENEKHRI